MDGAESRSRRSEIPPSDDDHKAMLRDRPLEESQKSYHTALEQEIHEAQEELERPASALLLSGLAAGLDLGFGPFAMAVGITLFTGLVPREVLDLGAANLYTIGFIFVVMGRSALFTEHTTSAVLPVLAGRSPVRRLLRIWGLVLVANVTGAALFSIFAVTLGKGLGIIDNAALAEIAKPLLDKSAGIMILSAIAAGWLMGLLAWLTAAARDTISQIFFILITTVVIGFGKLHHSIAGTLEVLMAVFAGAGPGLPDYFRFMLWSVLGNVIGGAFFVAVLKYGHVRRSTAGS